MKSMQTPTIRRRLLIPGLIAGLIVVCTITAAFAQSDAPAASAEADFTLGDLAEMFGHSQVQGSFMELAVGMLPDPAAKESFGSALNEIRSVITASGINTDFAAPPPPTGDALFDAYAVEVDRKLNAFKAGDALDAVAIAVVPDDVMDSWEERFGDDPRYWELRYLLKVMAIDRNAPAAEQVELHLEAVEFLREARRRDCASANTLLLLYQEQVQAGAELLEVYSGYEGARSPSSHGAQTEMLPLRPDLPADRLARILEIQAGNEALEQELLDAAVALGPDEAWPYFLRGIRNLSLGELESGLADLQAGNAAPVNSYPRPYPMAFIDSTLATSTPAGGPVVCGAMQITLVGYPQPSYIALKDNIREAVAMVELGAPLELYDAWHGFACRLAVAWPSLPIQSMSSLAFIRILRSEMLSYHQDDLSQTQLDTLNRIQGAQEELKRLDRRSMGEFDFFSNFLPAIAAGGLRGMTMAFYLQAYVETASATQCLAPVFNDLAQISYLDLATPAAMLKYELLPDELHEARRAARKASQQVAEVIEDAGTRVTELQTGGVTPEESDATE